jgi:hypothetical protein
VKTAGLFPQNPLRRYDLDMLHLYDCVCVCVYMPTSIHAQGFKQQPSLK